MNVITPAAAAQGDDAFGPQLAGFFDFTLAFEHSVLSIVPTSIFLLLAPFQLNALLGRKPCIEPGLLLWLKMLTALLLLSCQVAILVLWVVSSLSRHDLAIAAAAMACLGSLVMFFLLYAEHIYSYRPSALLSLYITQSILFDIAKTRSYFLRGYPSSLARLSTAITLLQLILLSLHQFSKRRLAIARHALRRLSAEFFSGFWGRALFLWVISTLRLGFTSILRMEDLKDLGPEFSSERVHSQFHPYWQKSRSSSNHSLAWALFRCLYPEFLNVVIPRLFFIAFTFAQPWLIMAIINAVVQGNPSPDVSGGLVGTTALIYCGIGISRGYYKHYSYRTATLIRGILVTAILHKALKLSHSQLKKSAALTLITVDIQTLTYTVTNFHDFWASAIELVLAVVMLWKLVRTAALLVLIPAFVSASVSSYYTKKLRLAQATWNQQIEKRVATSKDVISQLKAIKMSGLAPFFTNRLQLLRDQEILTSLPERTVRVGLLSISAFSESITPVIVVAGAIFWTRKADKLTTSELFTLLSLVAIVVSPMTDLFTRLPFAISSYAGLTRIQSFLRLDERLDSRQTGNGPAQGSPIDTMAQQAESLRRVREAAVQGPSPFAVELVHATINRLDDSTMPLLDNISLQFRTGQVSMLVGPVGSGKSVLCKSILGEQKLDRGFVLMGSSWVAYCDQTPWLQNLCIRDCIVAYSEYVLPWYKAVIWGCALDDDLAQLPDGDKTMAGSGGALLSGGQKQRIALARAVYSRASVVVLDDVLSALDSETAQTILFRLLGEDGLLTSNATTVIITTNILEHLSLAHTIYALDGMGSVRETVNYAPDLVRKDYLVSISKEQATETCSSTSAFTPKPALELTEKEAFVRRNGDFSLYIYYFKSAGLWLIPLWMGTISLASVVQAMPQIYISIWADQSPDSPTWFIGYAVLGGAVGFVLAISLTFYYFKVVPISSSVLHKQLLETTMKAQLSFISKMESGAIVNMFSQDIAFLSQQLPQHFLEFSYTAVACLISIAVIVSGAAYAAMAVPALLFFLYSIQKFYLRTSRQIRHMDLEAKSPLLSLFQDVGDGIMHIRSFQWEIDIKWQGYGVLDYSQRPYYNMFAIQRWLALVMDLTVAGIAVMLISLAVFVPDSSSGGGIGLSLLTLINLSQRLSDLVMDWSNLETSMGAMARLREFNNTTPREMEPVGQPSELPDSWPLQGKIELTSVTARYDPIDVRPVLQNMSFTIRPKEKVAIIGRTGSGKSSLLLALLSFLDYSGSIRIDGRDLRSIPTETLRCRIVTICQDDVELDASVRTNLDPYELQGSQRVSDETMIDVLVRVRLWGQIQAAGGLDTAFRDAKLSRGQRQLLCVARAMLRRQQTGRGWC